MRKQRWTVAKVGDRALSAASSALHTVRRVRRPATEGTPEFDLAYVRSGPVTDTPAVVIPGGPGLASVLPYRALRRYGAQDGLDIIMVEHRGVGLSRADVSGVDLPRSAMWVESVLDDIAAVLDRERVDQAFIAGSSYGSYLASAFAVKYPERVAGMLLDSALQATADLSIERAKIREVFWDSPGRLAKLVREVTEMGQDQRVLLDVIRAGYELSGPDLVQSMLERRARGKSSAAWSALASYSARDASIVGLPGYYEFGRAGAIGFRELNYGARPDGKPLDPALTYSLLAPDFPAFVGDPYDLPAATPGFDWPLVLLVGDRDLRTPPAIAARTAELAPNATTVTIDGGHSALDNHVLSFEKTLKLLMAGQQERLPQVAEQLSTLPRRGAGAELQRFIEILAWAQAPKH